MEQASPKGNIPGATNNILPVNWRNLYLWQSQSVMLQTMKKSRASSMFSAVHQRTFSVPVPWFAFIFNKWYNYTYAKESF